MLTCASTMAMPMPAIHDEEGPRVAPHLPFVVDAHVHLFPERVFNAIWRWFEQFGWPIRYRLVSPGVLEFLLSRGVGHVVALTYAHKPGLARLMNVHMVETCGGNPRVTALGTVLPGEPDARAIVEDAFAMGLHGIKLHCHVQCFSPDAREMAEIYETCSKHDKPLVMHAGREPTSSGYRCDPHALCSADRVEHVLRNFPKLRLCVPHLGADEFDAYERLLERFDNLWLDTTMMLADYFHLNVPPRILQVRPDRIMYGSDFPNLPYAWDRELARIERCGLSTEALERLLGTNARAFFGVSET